MTFEAETKENSPADHSVQGVVMRVLDCFGLHVHW